MTTHTKNHAAEVTAMRNGMYRAECSCGWWRDHYYQGDAMHAMSRHAAVWR